MMQDNQSPLWGPIKATSYGHGFLRLGGLNRIGLQGHQCVDMYCYQLPPELFLEKYRQKVNQIFLTAQSGDIYLSGHPASLPTKVCLSRLPLEYHDQTAHSDVLL